MAKSILLVFCLGSLCQAGDIQDALNHRGQFPTQEVYHTYLTVGNVPEDQREGLIKALAFMIASSSRQPITDYTTPDQVGTTLWHLDLQRVKWDVHQWINVLEGYPYYTGGSYPLIVRADWLLVQLADSNGSDVHDKLLYGPQGAPKTLKDFRQAWGVDNALQHRFGLVESDSGVSVQRVRWLENRPLSRGYYWETKDVIKLEPGKDPLEALDGKFSFDGMEVIAGIPKVSIKKGTRGTLQVYLLADGKGNVISKADTDLVEDHSRFRGLAAIRTSGSCVGCHVRGIITPTTNEFVQLIKLGVDTYAKDEGKQEQLELFHLGDTSDEIEYQQKLYAKGVDAVNHLTPEENAKAFREAIHNYDRAMSLTDVARELYTSEDELKLAIAHRSNSGSLPARVAGLAHGKPIQRTNFERHYSLIRQALDDWNTK